MIYSALPASQQAQCESLFRDSHFGSDPSAYEYEVTRGQVTGRAPLSRERITTTRPRKIAVKMMAIEIEPTASQVEAWKGAIKAMGRIVAESGTL